MFYNRKNLLPGRVPAQAPPLPQAIAVAEQCSRMAMASLRFVVWSGGQGTWMQDFLLFFLLTFFFFFDADDFPDGFSDFSMGFPGDWIDRAMGRMSSVP